MNYDAYDIRGTASYTEGGIENQSIFVLSSGCVRNLGTSIPCRIVAAFGTMKMYTCPSFVGSDDN